MTFGVTYRGRFAPSPTGPLHFGSLVAATGSYLHARQARGQWLVRIEDLDPPRTVIGAAENILHTLEAFGFHWDEPVIYQSQRNDAYEHAFQSLKSKGLVYPCACTRSELQTLQNHQSEPHDELHYPGLCRNGPIRNSDTYAWRFRVPKQPITFIDGIQGEQCINLQDSIGDFVIKRRDGLFAYQLAVVVDDAAQGMTDVVRGADLLSNTPRQIALQHALGLPTPRYAHLPVITDVHGLKLSKSTHAAALDLEHPVITLWQVLHCLRQDPPESLKHSNLNTLWDWAIAHWNTRAMNNTTQIALN